MSSLPPLLETFPRLHLAVLGEAMLDRYLSGPAARLSREAPVPIVTVAGQRDVPGGAANTAANVRALGGRVTLLSVVGDDGEGAALRGLLADAGVAADAVVPDAGRRTLVKARVVADGQMLLRVDQGSTAPVTGEAEAALVQALHRVVPACQGLIISDYGYGICTPAVVDAVRALRAAHPALLVVDARDLRPYRPLAPTAVKPNYAEALRLLGEAERVGADRVAQVAAVAQRLLERTGAQAVAVTLDTDGALLLERGAPPYRTYARPTRHSRAAGAGDTFTAALALALAAGAHPPAAVELASAAAAVVVGQEGTAVCAAADLRESLAAGSGKVAGDVEALAARLAAARRQGKRVIFTNGCFDLLHRGHIAYLNRAKTLGDVLVVAVNSDASVRRLKGPGRPITPLEDRLQVLAALSCVDHLIAFDEETPVALLHRLRPDVFVKGGDYTKAMLPEAPVVEALGGRVHILPYVEDRSTTGIIERIVTTYAGSGYVGSGAPGAGR